MFVLQFTREDFMYFMGSVYCNVLDWKYDGKLTDKS